MMASGKMKILIAEDDPISRRILTRFLARWGHEVVVTANGAEAWQCFQEAEAPSIAVLDWMMPVMDGIEVCRRVRQSELRISPYIIILTAKHGIEQLVTGMEAGADDYLTKPYDIEEFRVRLEVGLRIIGLQRKLSERVEELQGALDQVKQLQGILPICCYCRKIRDDEHYWQSLETYISTRSDAQFSHSICPTCFDEIVKPQLDSIEPK
jgi:phosphoserine phosphatase RsbU/P